MKKSIAFIAVAAIAGCTAIFAGCGSSNKNLAALSSTWYSDASFKGIQPTAIGEENGEKITYDVNFVAPSENGGNKSYSVNYAAGEYTTQLYATEFDVSIFDASTEAQKYKTEYETAKAENGGMTVYRYATTLTIPSVTYTLNTTEKPTKTFDNISIETDCYFTSVECGLKPVYSKRTIHNAVPAYYQTNTLEGIYKVYDRTYEVFYKYADKAAQTVTEAVTALTLGAEDINYVAGKEKVVATTNSPESSANSLFDDCSLDVAVRACNVGDGASQAISLFSTANNVSNYTLSGSSATLVLDPSNADSNTAKINELTQKLKTAGLYEEKKDSEGNVIGLKTSAVTVGTGSGVSQTYWFTAVENRYLNTGKAVMLKYSAPLTYALGTVNYNLKTIERVFNA